MVFPLNPFVFAQWLIEWRRKRRFECHKTTRIYPSGRITSAGPRESISIGAESHIHGQLQTFTGEACITIGAHVFLGPGALIWAHERIEIGNRVLISHNVTIIDSNSHSLSASERYEEYLSVIKPGVKRIDRNVMRKPVVIKDDAWIGYNSSIMKGVTIGHGAVVGANSVVTKDVADFTIVVGNPARFVGPSLR